MQYYDNRMLLLDSYWEALHDKFISIFSFDFTNPFYILLKFLGLLIFFIPFLGFAIVAIVMNLLAYAFAGVLIATLFVLWGGIFRSSNFDGIGEYFNFPLIISRFLICFIFDALQTLFFILCTLPDLIFKTENYEKIDCFGLYTFFFKFIIYCDIYTLFKYNESYRKLLDEMIIKEKAKQAANASTSIENSTDTNIDDEGFSKNI